MHSNDSQRWPDHERALPDATVAAAGPTDSTAATPKQSSQHPDPYSKSDGPLTTTTSREATPPVDPKAHRSPTSLPQDVVEKIKDVQADPYRVVFEPNDPDDPKNWNELRKWQIMIVTLALQIWANNISATVAPGLPLIAQDFNVSPAASRVVQATYLYGFACGPVLTAPLSEDFGRVPVMLLGGLGMGLFQLHCALSPNYGSLLVARFLAGFFAAATFNSVGTVADLWIPERQGWGVNGFALSAELGVVIASVYSGFLVQRTGGWRWLFGVTGIVTGFLLLLFALTVPETNNGVLLSRRARRLRKSTGDDRYFSDHDRAREARTRMDTIREVIIRPAHMLITEPIVSAFAAFDGYNYCIIYLLVEAAPVIYTDYHGFSMPFQSFAFIGMGVGFIVAFLCYPIPQAIVRRAARKSPTGVPEPESLLKWGLFVSPCFPISILYVSFLLVQLFGNSKLTHTFVCAAGSHGRSNHPFRGSSRWWHWAYSASVRTSSSCSSRTIRSQPMVTLAPVP